MEYYQKQTKDFLKLEYLKHRVKLDELYRELDGITDEHWRAAKEQEIEEADQNLKLLDQVWFFKYKEHIPFEEQE